MTDSVWILDKIRGGHGHRGTLKITAVGGLTALSNGVKMWWMCRPRCSSPDGSFYLDITRRRKSKRPKEKMFGAPRDLHDNLLLPLNGHCEVTTAGGPIYKDVRKGVR
ncbi:hypothetical protein GW17_00025574 [Ensete ventricosum]|nr:hypothetical protein GW17_00025574 [Ensete ventricosum]